MNPTLIRNCAQQHFEHSNTILKEYLISIWDCHICVDLSPCTYIVPGEDLPSLVPRPLPSFRHGFTVLQATGSWARAWERGYGG